MVGVAQLVELRIVIPAVEGSSPFTHPIDLPRKSIAIAFSDLVLVRAQN